MKKLFLAVIFGMMVGGTISAAFGETRGFGYFSGNELHKVCFSPD